MAIHNGTNEQVDEYFKLVARYRAVSQEAADALIEMPKFFADKGGYGFYYSATLLHAFNWSQSPQGDDYWRNLCRVVENSRAI